MDRTILHCDLNGFYASVECIYRPELKDVPMAVCGDPENRHGIILAKNELAKRFGVLTAETIYQAKRKCPDLVLVPPHHDRYYKYSRLINELYERYTDMVEPFGIDESWLDVTGSIHLFGSGKEIADKIRADVKSEFSLTVSVGVSFNKVFAKLGSDYRKPDATTVITRDNYKEIVWPLPVSDLLYVGKSAAAQLAKIGIRTIGQLAAYDKNSIVQTLGKMGEKIFEYANGIDESEVSRASEPKEIKSVGNGMTFKRNLVGIEDIKSGVRDLSDTVAARLRKYALKCAAVQVMIKDPAFHVISRQKKLPHPTQLSREISTAAVELIQSSWDLKAPIRMITVTGLNLVPQDECQQLDLFDKEDGISREKIEKIEKTIDQIRTRFGKSSISFGAAAKEDIGIKTFGRKEKDED